jgi:hypothetical protein
MGVPVSDDRLMVGVNFDVEDEVDDYNEELVKKTVAAGGEDENLHHLRERNLPIPPDLKAEVESVLMPQQAPPGASPGGLPGGPPAPGGPGAPMNGAGGPAGGPGEGIVMPTPPMGLGPGQGGPPVGAGAPPATPQGAMGPGGGSTAPPVSMERRHGLPRPASTQAKVADSEDAEAQVDTVSEQQSNVPERLVEKLPRASGQTKKYTIVDDEESSEVPNDKSGSGRDGTVTEGDSKSDQSRDDSEREEEQREE